VYPSPISLVRVVCLGYVRFTSIHPWAVGAWIRGSKISMVVSYQLDRGVKIGVFMALSMMFSVVPISFLQKRINFQK